MFCPSDHLIDNTDRGAKLCWYRPPVSVRPERDQPITGRFALLDGRYNRHARLDRLGVHLRDLSGQFYRSEIDDHNHVGRIVAERRRRRIDYGECLISLESSNRS